MSASGDSTVTHFCLTGFGEFRGVKDNPTKQLMENLPKFLNDHPLPSNILVDSMTVLETSGVGSRETFQSLCHSCKPEEVQKKQARQVWLHFGVHAGSTQFKLESYGYNEATFRCPDQRDWAPQGEQIHVAAPDAYRTNIDVDYLVKELSSQAVEGKHGWKCIVSTDPGRFVCNWMFYNSLHRACADCSYSLFVHVPQHNIYSLEEQLAFARNVMIAIAQSLDQQEKVGYKQPISVALQPQVSPESSVSSASASASPVPASNPDAQLPTSAE